MERYIEENVRLAGGIVPESDADRALKSMRRSLESATNQPSKVDMFADLAALTFREVHSGMTAEQHEEGIKILEGFQPLRHERRQRWH
jgi:hypothetical protein